MPTTPLLHLDTTTSRLHLAISADGGVLCEINQPCESHRYHSAVIVPAIQDMLRQNSLKASHLTALAVHIGPGSFTGVRTGIITARTMGQFLGIPVYAFNAFELLATQTDAPVSIYLDALRNRTYHATLTLGEDGVIYHQEPALKTLDPEAPPTHAEQLLIAPSLAPLFAQSAFSEIQETYSPIQPMLQLIKRYGDKRLQQWDTLKPLYLQDPSITLKKKKTASPAT